MNNITFINKGLCGLTNIANTCYMNTGIHLINSSLPLTVYFLTNSYKKDLHNKNPELLLQYIELIRNIWTENKIITPHNYYKSFLELIVKQDNELCRFVPNSQQDLNEYLVFLLDYFNSVLCKEVEITINGEVKNDRDKIALEAVKSWKKSFEKEYSIIIELFYGQFMSITSCPNCNYFSNSYEPFNNVNLPIPDKEDNLDIYDCFNLLTENEILDSDNAWKCDKCNQLQNAEKKILFWKIPNILIIFFNRFKDLSKLSVKISYPINNLDLTKYTFNYNNSKNIYNLTGIGNYFGNGSMGHYTAIIKNKNEKWYHIDDENITEVSEDDIKGATQHVYCLFYIKT